MSAVQLDFFSDLATEPDWIALLRRAAQEFAAMYWEEREREEAELEAEYDG